MVLVRVGWRWVGGRNGVVLAKVGVEWAGGRAGGWAGRQSITFLAANETTLFLSFIENRKKPHPPLPLLIARPHVRQGWKGVHVRVWRWGGSFRSLNLCK